jgi:hypothetical protein
MLDAGRQARLPALDPGPGDLATPKAQVNTLALIPPSSRAVCTTFACIFSKIRGGPAMKVGRMIARFSAILSMRPSTAVGKPICSWTASSILPKA